MVRTSIAVLLVVLAGAAAHGQGVVAPSPPPPAATSDAELLSALTRLFNPFVLPAERVDALATPAIRDPRAIPPLVFLLADPDAAVRAGAARALGAFAGDARVERALIGRLRWPVELDIVRVAVIEALARQGGASAGQALYELYVDDSQPLALRTAARHALEARFPELIRTKGNVEVVDRSGRGMLTAGSAVLGSFALASVGALGQNTAGVTIGAFGGLVVGAGSAYLLTRTGEITRAQSGWMLTGGFWGASLGMLAAGTAESNPSTRFVLSLGLAGEALGAAGTIVSRTNMGYTAGDVALINIGGVLGADLAAGAYLLQDRDRPQLLAGAVLGASAAGLAVASAIAPRTSFRSDGDRALAAEGAYEGLGFGLLIPTAVGSTNGRRTSAGAALGLGLGFAVGAAASQVTELDPRDVGIAWLIGGYGKLLGLSLPLLGDGNDASLARGTIAGSAISLAAAAAVAPRLEFHRGDPALVALGTGLGLWHGAAFATSTNRLSGSQQTGVSLLGVSVGGLGTMALSQQLDLTEADVLALGGGAFWGNWFTLWGSSLALGPTDKLDLRPAVLVGDVGLAATALLVTRVDARRIGIANLGGLAGAGLASLGAALATKNNNTVITANLVGSGLGLIGGAFLASSLELAPVTKSATTKIGSLHLGTPMIGPLVVPASAGTAVGMTVTFVQ
jgi:hypothetical protein